MLPASWENRNYQQAQQYFQPSQPSLQLTQTSVGSCQAGTANNATLFGPVNRGLSSQEATFLCKNGNWQYAYTTRQAGNNHLVNNATAPGQVATVQYGQQISVANLSTQNLSDTMTTNTTYCHQNMPTRDGLQVVLPNGNQLQWVQNGNLISNNDQQNKVQRNLHLNGNGIWTGAFLAHKGGVTSTSSPSVSVQITPMTQSMNYSQSAQQSASSSTPQIKHLRSSQLSINRPATTNSLPTTHNYHTSNNIYVNNGGVATSSINMNLKSQGAQQVGSFPIPQPIYNVQLSRNEPVTTNTLPSKQNWQSCSRSYVKGTGVVASSSRTNSNGNQYETNHLANLGVTGQHTLRQQSTNLGENISLKVPCQTLTRSPNGHPQFVSKQMRSELKPTMQPVAHSAANSCNSNSVIFTMLTDQPSAKNTNSMPTLRLSTDTLPQQSFASKDLSITRTAGGSGATINRDGVELKAQLSTEKEHEMLEELEMFIRLYSNDNSIHSSGHTVTKAVAVVPPLSQKNVDTASECTTSIKQCSQYTEVQKSLPEGLKEGSLHSKDNCQTPPKTSDRSSKPSSTPVSSSELPQSQNTKQKVVSISDRGPELSVNMEKNQRVTQACPSEVLTQTSTMENSETPADPKLCAYDLSSIPTVQWTAQKLNSYIDSLLLTEKPKTTSASRSNILKILQMFWGGSIQNITKFVSESYKNILLTTIGVCGKPINPNTVILSEVKDDFVKGLENYRILKHNEIYEDGIPYVSSWLNINEKLDDIDKEFGFPWSLRTCQMSDSESQQDCTSINTNAEISNEASNKSLSQMELEPADSHKEECNTDDKSSKQCGYPTESSADSSDPHYSFTIQVLPPEEAKIIFEKNKIKLQEDRLPQETTEGCTKDDSPSIVKGSHKTTDVCQMQQICCLSKWMETLIGANSDLMSKCQCKVDPAVKDCTEGKFTSPKQAQVEENSDNNMTSSLPEIDKTLFLNGDFLGADDTPQACEPFHDSMDSTNSSIIFISENKDQEQITNQMHNPEEDSELAPIESPGSNEYSTSEETEKQTEIVTSDGSFSEIGWDCIQPEQKSTDMPEPPMEEKGDTHPHAMAAGSPTRPSKRKKDMRTAELILFGSTSQGTHDSVEPSPSSAVLPDGAPRPPKMLSVDIRPLKLSTSETIRTDNCPVKKRLYEKWRRSLPPPTIRHNKAGMLRKLPVHRASFMKAKKLGPTSTKDQSLMLDVHDKQRLDQKKKGFLGLKKRRKSKLAKPTECQSRGVVDPHEGNILGFNVLPTTFIFKGGSNKNSNTTDSETDKTLLAEADNERSSNAEKKARDTWYPKPVKMYSPLRPTTVQPTSGVFHEFQKRYMKKTQSPTDA